MVGCMKKCRRFAKVEVMEVTQVVGMRTRARSLALAAAAAAAAAAGVSRGRTMDRSADGKVQMGYLKLRSRSLVMSRRGQSKLVHNSEGRISGSGERIISQCSSSSSCEAAEEDVDILFPTVRVQTPCEDVAISSMCEFEYSRDRREISLSSNQNIHTGELESSAKRKSRQSTPDFRTPSSVDIEEFFTAAEKSEKQRFVTRYNFDFDNEVPLKGRYEWIRINP